MYFGTKLISLYIYMWITIVWHSCGNLPIVAISRLSALSILWSNYSPYGFLIKVFGQKGPGTNAQTDRQTDKDNSNALLSRFWVAPDTLDLKRIISADIFTLFAGCMPFILWFYMQSIFNPIKFVCLKKKKTAIKI